MTVNVAFDQIRAFDGRKDRAFEELSFQLIKPLMPAHERLERPGDPDAGVEFIIWLEDGSARAWQSKFFTEGIGETQRSQMRKSFETAIKAYPEIQEYTFCVPHNPPSESPREGRTSSMQLWREAKERWEEWAKAQGSSVSIEYFGESDLLGELTKDEHAGRRFYWFDQTALTSDWFNRNLEAALETAGPRYTRELHVELDIAQVFEGLGRTERWSADLQKALAEVKDSLRLYESSFKPEDEDLIAHIEPIEGGIQGLDVAVRSIDLSSDESIDLGGLDRDVGTVEDALNELQATISDRQYEERRAHQGRGSPPADTRRDNLLYELSRLEVAIRSFGRFVRDTGAELVNTPALLVTGPAGIGKTHLLCDVARERLDADRPTVTLLGQHFANQEPWTQVLRQLGLGCTRDEFLGALSAAAEARDGRALIMIDALNEGEGLLLWPNHLVAFLRAIRQWPQVGVALSCRQSYRKALIPSQITASELVTVAHSGFAGVEYAATKRFFAHYGLTMPDFPLVVPEFQNPLFLKLACKALQERGLTTLPREASALSWMFEEVLKAVNERLADRARCNYSPAESPVHEAVGKLADEIEATGDESISFARAQEIVNAVLPRDLWVGSLLEGLIAEGILSQDRIGDDEFVHFAYQRLGDHVRAASFCSASADADALGIALQERLRSGERRIGFESGLYEALAIQIPERFAVELHELVDVDALEYAEQEILNTAFMDSLVWRRPDAIDRDAAWTRWREVALRNEWTLMDGLERLLQVACLPDHPLNALWLHDRLMSPPSMAARDHVWTEHLVWDSEDGSQVTRIVEWARGDDTSYAADDAALLCALALAWFCASPNRYIRDGATKGIVSLLRLRLSVMKSLLEHFAEVDDPYVTERLFAAAYGCVMASSDSDGILDLAQYAYDRLFVENCPVPDAMTRDYARGIIERAGQLDLLPPEIELDRVRPPYESDPIEWPELEEDELAERYPVEKYGVLTGMLGSLSDFRTYTVDYEIRRFEDADSVRAAKWIFQRVIELGWRPEWFAEYDKRASERRFRGADGIERFGKKYQWIALHELVARLADTRQVSEDPWDEGAYEGPWQTGLRDADPSQLLARSEADSSQASMAPWWSPVEISIPRMRTADEREAWLRDQALTTPEHLISVADAEGRRWLALDGSYRWSEKQSPLDEADEEDQARLTVWLNSYLIRRADLEPMLAWIREIDWSQGWSLDEGNLSYAFLGEHPWHPAARRYQVGWSDDADRGVRSHPLPAELAPTTSTYSWSEDFAFQGALNVSVPSATILDGMDLGWSGRDFGYRGTGGDDDVAWFPAAREPGPPVLLMDQKALTGFLEDHQLAIWWKVDIEQRVWPGGLSHKSQASGTLEMTHAFLMTVGELEKVRSQGGFSTFEDQRKAYDAAQKAARAEWEATQKQDEMTTAAIELSPEDLEAAQRMLDEIQKKGEADKDQG